MDFVFSRKGVIMEKAASLAAFLNKKMALGLVFGIASISFADNPISNYHYLADPAATASEDEFFILTDSDDPAGADGYTIKSLYAFSSRDMKNWTDYGIIFEAKREYDNINDIWASGIDIGPDGKFYIVYPDGGGGGVGMVASENINGPYENPIPGNKKLIHNWGGGISDCDGIGWCFDPAIYFDDDGTGYFTFGGGNSDSRPAAENNNNIFNIYRLNSSLDGFDVNTKIQLKIGGPKAMEASYIHKKGSTYYLSYSTADLRIAYGTSDRVTGPYTYQGIFMDNPNINGQNINAHNNNHHGIAEFKGKWYAVYHDRRLVQAAEHPASLGVANPEPAYHRSVSIDEFTYNGTALNKLVYTNEGPKQIANFDPYSTYPALTSSKQRNVRSRTDWTRGKPVSHVLTPYASKDSWIRVSGVDFGGGAMNFLVTAASVADGNKIEIRKGSSSGTLAGTCELPKTSGWLSYEQTECEVTGLSGVVDELFIVFKGAADSTMGVLEWEFSGKPSEPQKPYGEQAIVLPNLIEAEHFDRGGARKVYNDAESENQGDASFRTDEGVDIVLNDNGGMAIGYTESGEWLEYTVNVTKSGEYDILARVASGSTTSGIQLFIDEEAITAEFTCPQTAEDSWDVYEEVSLGKATLTEGEHVLKLAITGSYVNVDWLKFLDENGETSIGKSLVLGNVQKETSYTLYDMQGKELRRFTARDFTEALNMARQNSQGFVSGIYLLKQSGKNAMVKKFWMH